MQVKNSLKRCSSGNKQKPYDIYLGANCVTVFVYLVPAVYFTTLSSCKTRCVKAHGIMQNISVFVHTAVYRLALYTIDNSFAITTL